ncbi:MAG TPA: carotenoid 1,2-hydratase [Opitutaceae bacterium]
MAGVSAPGYNQWRFWSGVLLVALLAGTGLRASDTTSDGFALPQPGHHFEFPADYGSHPAFRIEWWYITGHLFAGDERRFGFQATFFRLAGSKGAAEASPDFARNEVYLAHMAVTDIKTGKFFHTERLNRAGWDAHSAVGRLELANGPWSLAMDSTGIMKLDGSVDAKASFQLSLKPTKPLVVFGDDGVSHKGAEASAASYYLTFPQLAAEGQLTVGEQGYRVHGEAWMDHEISSSQLGSRQVGWDWTCIQFQDSPWQLMLYRLRRADGTADPASKLQWVDPASHAVTSDFEWKVLDWWTSPRTHGRYPARIELTSVSPATRRPVHLILQSLVPDQELSNALGGGPYWEGACRVTNADTGKEIGSAYLELTGYVTALKM